MPPAPRPALAFVTLACAAAVTAGCASMRTIMIPRFAAGGAGDDPFAGEVFRVDRSVAGQDYALLAAAFGTTLHLGARVVGDFRGEVVWRAGDLRLVAAIDTAETARQVAFTVTGGDAPHNDLDGRVAGDGTATTVGIELPHATLRGGDGTLVLEFVPAGGGDAVALPASGRLRGVYIQR